MSYHKSPIFYNCFKVGALSFILMMLPVFAEARSWCTSGCDDNWTSNTISNNVTLTGASANNVVVGLGADWYDRPSSDSVGGNWNVSSGTGINSSMLNFSNNQRTAIYNLNVSNSNVSFSIGRENNSYAGDPEFYLIFYQQNGSCGYATFYCPGYRLYFLPSFNQVRLRHVSSTLETQVGSSVTTFQVNASDIITVDTATVSTGLKVYKNGTLSITINAGNTSYSEGYIGFMGLTAASSAWTVNDFRIFSLISGNITTYYDLGAGTQGSQVMFNFTNTSGSFVDGYASADNLTWVLIQSNMTNATFISIPASAKNQTQYIRAVLKGNTTSTPELMQINMTSETTSAISCTDAGSDNVSNGIILVGHNSTQSNCWTNTTTIDSFNGSVGYDDIIIQQAFDNATGVSSGKRIHLLAGNFTLNQTVFFNNNTEVYGDGFTTIVNLRDAANWSGLPDCINTTRKPAIGNETGQWSSQNGAHENSSGLFRARNVDVGGGWNLYNISFHDFYIEGNYNGQCENQGDDHYELIQFGGVFNFSIYNMKFNGSLYDQIRIVRGSYGVATNGTIYNNTMLSGGHSNIGVTSADNVTIRDNNLITNINSGIRMLSVRNSTIMNNTIHGSEGSQYGIELDPVGSNFNDNNIIQNNTINGMQNIGIFLFADNAETIPAGRFNNNTIKGNRIYHNAFANSDIWNHGIWIAHANNTLVEGNSIYNNNGSGIVFQDYPEFTGSWGNPHKVPYNLTATVKNNIIMDNDRYGIELNSSNWTVSESFNMYYSNDLGNNDSDIVLGTGTITGQDPLFFNVSTRNYGPWPNNTLVDVVLDFHLRSQYNRWNGSGWVQDVVTSPAIEVGDPSTVISNCPSWGCPTIIELGSYGNTVEASWGGAPLITYIPPSPGNASTVTANYTKINVSIVEPNLSTFIFNWSNTNYSIYDRSLFAAYNFNNYSAIGDSVTVLKDISQYGNDGVIAGGASYNQSGKFGGGMHFDGIDDIITIANSASLNRVTNQLTVEAWVYPYEFPIDGLIVRRGAAAAGERSYTLITDPLTAPSQFIFGIRRDVLDTWLFANTTGNHATGRWYYVVGVFNGTHSMMYLNGERNGSTQAYTGNIQDSTTNLWIGGMVGTEYLNMEIDDVRIYNRSLSADEIQKRYTLEFYKHNTTQWYADINLTSLTDGVYSYYSWANDTISTSNQTDVMQVTVDTTTSPYTPQQVTIQCPAGWCFLAMNYSGRTLSEIDNMFSSDRVHSRYNSTSQRYETHYTGYTSNQNSNVSQKMGYAMYFTSTTNVAINLTANPSITLSAGWNLIGNMQSARNLSALRSSIGAEATQARHFNLASQSWVSSDSEIVPAGEAFFVYLTASKIWSG